MKNGIFRTLTALTLGLSLLQLSGCAGFLELTEEGDPADYDRGYAAADADNCTGRFCDTESDEASGPSRSLAHVEHEGRGGTRVKQAIETRDVILGMTRQDVMQSWGEPVQREVAGNGNGGHERWTYGTRYSFSGARTVIFENGRVAGWHR